MKPTVVQLEGGTEGSEISFEQAFGEFSEARGRGRARRQKRRLDRIAKRRELRKARQEALREKMRARQERLAERKKMRLDRKNMGKEEEEEEPTEDGEKPTEDGATDSGDGGSGAPINQEGDSVKDNQGEGQGEYQGEGGGYSANDEGQNSEGADAVVDSETGESDEESGFTGDSNFDGAIMLSPEDAEWNEYFSSADGIKKINPKVRQLSLAIEKEKHLIGILKKRRTRLIGTRNPKAQKNLAIVNGQIQNRTQRLSRMETKLASYSRFEGDYSEARGGKRGVAKRKAEVRHAKKYARKLRKRAMKKRRVTEVEEGLEPQFSTQMIEVPAERSNFNGTGLIGLDEQGDIDAPETRKFDLIFSNAEGDEAKKQKRKKLIIGISVGVAVGVLAIVLIKKFGKK